MSDLAREAAVNPKERVDRWLSSLEVLYPVPQPHRRDEIDRRQALDMLRCGELVLDELVAAGLPHAPGPDGVLFDRHDLINVALQSGSGMSTPERAVRFALRWMREDPSTWQDPLEWTFHIELRCDLADSDANRCGDAGEFRHTRLLPELNAGTIRSWRSSGAVHLDDTSVTLSGPGPVAMSGRLRTNGRLMSLRSPGLRAITREFIQADYRWARLPKAVQADYQTVMAHGVAPCVTASLFLEQQYRAAGYQAFARSGWILGMLDLAHAWVEVLDDDGQTKCVDVVFDRLSRHADGAHPRLAEAALGSRVNRILPTSCGAGEPHASHICVDGRRAIPMISTVIRRLGAN